MRHFVFGFLILAAACASQTGSSNVNAAADAGTLPRPVHNDEEIAMVIRVANLGEIRESGPATTKATAQAVRDYATMMVNDHTTAEDKIESTLSKAKIAFSDSDVSRQLDADSGRAATRLVELSGAGYDRAYMDRAIEVHANLLEMLDRSLIPTARKSELKTILSDVRKTVQTHLDRARQIRATLT